MPPWWHACACAAICADWLHEAWFEHQINRAKGWVTGGFCSYLHRSLVKSCSDFPEQTPDHLKTPTAEEAFNKNGLSQRTIRLLKDAFPDLEVRGRG